ncbi:hypothetical protein GCM10010234_79300 [Streptomyces hawaiiensis]
MRLALVKRTPAPRRIAALAGHRLIIVQRGTAGRACADDLREYGVEFTVAAETQYRDAGAAVLDGVTTERR